MMADVFISYETGLTQLLERLGKDHLRYPDALTLQSRLRENIAQTQHYGDTETRRAERAQIVDTLNRLAMETVGVSLGDLSSRELESQPERQPGPELPVPLTPTPPSSPPRPESESHHPPSSLWIFLSIIAAAILGLVSNVLAPILLPVNTPQRLLIALGLFCLALATMLWIEFRKILQPTAGWSLWVTRLLVGIGVLCLAGGIVWSGIIAMPSAIETGTPVPTPTPDCSSVQVAYLELDLLSETKKYDVEHGEIAREIVLKPSEIDGLQNLLGRAELGPTVREGCTCYWEGRTGVAAPWEPITSSIDRCSFSIGPLPTQVQSVALSLTIGEQPPPRIFAIRVLR